MIQSIKQFPAYLISDHGVVSRSDTKKIITPFLVKGKPYVTLYASKKKKTVGVHTLVAEAFVPNPYKLKRVGFKDEDPLNLRAANLKWVRHDGKFVEKKADNQSKVWPCNNWKFAIGDCLYQHASQGHSLVLFFEFTETERLISNIRKTCKVAGIEVNFANP